MGNDFDRQLKTLLAKGYPELAGMTEDAFVQLVEPLRQTAVDDGRRFVIVIADELVAAHRSMRLTELDGRPGFADFEPADLGRFTAVKELAIPAGGTYLIFDVDRGSETRNVTPDDALIMIRGLGRSPLTVAEGIAVITQFPDLLEKNNCFSLLGSRCGDRRVPALWISKRAPKLGWCWAGNPHTWLGSASCGSRAGLAVTNRPVMA